MSPGDDDGGGGDDGGSDSWFGYHFVTHQYLSQSFLRRQAFTLPFVNGGDDTGGIFFLSRSLLFIRARTLFNAVLNDKIPS